MTDEERMKLAQAIADECGTPGVTSARFRTLWALAKETRADDDQVCIDREQDEWQQLDDRLGDLWKTKGGAA